MLGYDGIVCTLTNVLCCFDGFVFGGYVEVKIKRKTGA